MAISPSKFRGTLGHFPTGVVVVSALDETGAPIGLTIGSFVSVSLDPPLVAFLPGKDSYTSGEIKKFGKFCVNVLSADQDQLCRRLASNSPDRFAGIGWTPAAASGAPILDGVVAWIDCEVHAVHAAGDHEIVIGAVQDLDVARGELPLIFFRGGYGEFSSPWLTAPAAPHLAEPLRRVDLARSEMMALASDLNVECLASALVADEMVIVGSAGKPGKRLVSALGQCVPLTPPLGIYFMAWADEVRFQRWISNPLLARPGVDRDRILESVDRVRERGWSLALAGDAQIALETAVADIAAYPPTKEQTRAVVEAAEAAPTAVEFEPELGTADGPHHVRHINAPVFSAAGEVVLALGLYGLPRRLSSDEIRKFGDRLLEACRAVGEVIEEHAALDPPVLSGSSRRG